MCAFDLSYEGESAAILRAPRFDEFKKKAFPHNPRSSGGVTPGRACSRNRLLNIYVPKSKPFDICICEASKSPITLGESGASSQKVYATYCNLRRLSL